MEMDKLDFEGKINAPYYVINIICTTLRTSGQGCCQSCQFHSDTSLAPCTNFLQPVEQKRKLVVGELSGELLHLAEVAAGECIMRTISENTVSRTL